MYHLWKHEAKNLIVKAIDLVSGLFRNLLYKQSGDPKDTEKQMKQHKFPGFDNQGELSEWCVHLSFLSFMAVAEPSAWWLA